MHCISIEIDLDEITSWFLILLIITINYKLESKSDKVKPLLQLYTHTHSTVLLIVTYYFVQPFFIIIIIINYFFILLFIAIYTSIIVVSSTII